MEQKSPPFNESRTKVSEIENIGHSLPAPTKTGADQTGAGLFLLGAGATRGGRQSKKIAKDTLKESKNQSR